MPLEGKASLEDARQLGAAVSFQPGLEDRAAHDGELRLPKARWPSDMSGQSLFIHSGGIEHGPPIAAGIRGRGGDGPGIVNPRTSLSTNSPWIHMATLPHRLPPTGIRSPAPGTVREVSRSPSRFVREFHEVFGLEHPNTPTIRDGKVQKGDRFRPPMLPVL